MTDRAFLVEKLKQEPFNYTDLTVIGFSDKKPDELLHLVSDVFTHIAPNHKRVDREPLEATVSKVFECLKAVKYNPNLDPANFRKGLSEGDVDIIHPILRWVLPQWQQLQKRAFVGYYLSFPEMPEEFRHEADIIQAKQEIAELHPMFIETHKELGIAKKGHKDPAELRARIEALDNEKAALAEKITKVRSKVNAAMPQHADVLEACSKLRQLKEAEKALHAESREQRELKDKAEAAHQKVVTKLRDMRTNLASSGSNDWHRMEEQVADEVAGLRAQVHEAMPKEMEAKSKRLQRLTAVLSNAISSEGDLQSLKKKELDLKRDVEALTQELRRHDEENRAQPAYLKLRQAQQMSIAVGKKKDEVTAKLDRLTEKKRAAQAEYERRVALEEGATGVSEEEWRAKYDAVKNRLPEYKRMRQGLGALDAELAALERTVRLLSETESASLQQVHKLEREMGVQGFTDAAVALEKVSEQKSAVDDAKGETLEEISKTVQEINAKIKQRKSALAPQIKELRSVRQSFQELEAKHTEAKRLYDEKIREYETRSARLDEEVAKLQSSVASSEGKYHGLGQTAHMTDVVIKQVTDGSHRDMVARLKRTVDSAEKESKHLKERQRAMRDIATSGVGNKEMLEDLKGLLELKNRMVMGNLYGGEGAMGYSTDAGNVVTF